MCFNYTDRAQKLSPDVSWLVVVIYLFVVKENTAASSLSLFQDSKAEG
jgi:hypothetical protein